MINTNEANNGIRIISSQRNHSKAAIIAENSTPRAKVVIVNVIPVKKHVWHIAKSSLHRH